MRIGLFGGTFDPPHLGHLGLCRAASQQLGLDRLLWLLTPSPPHKNDSRLTSLPHRLGMVTLALTGTPFELSRLDLDRPSPHYAVDTVALLAAQHPGADLIYLMGSDSLNDLPTWHQPAQLLAALHTLAVLHRPGQVPDLSHLEVTLPGLTARLCLLEAPPVDISSSQVRQLARSGQPFGHLVPPSVFRYIRENRLYRPRPHD